MYTPVSLVDALFEVDIKASPSNYLINHIRFNKPPQTLNWYGIKVLRKTSGYPEDPTDGVVIRDYTSDDVVILVNSVSSAGAITSASLINYGSAYTPVRVNNKKIRFSPTVCYKYGGSTGGVGNGASLDLSWNGSSWVVDVIAPGSGYKVNDFLRVAGDSNVQNITDGTSLVLPGITKYESLGESYYYHLYDDGTNLANTTNPGDVRIGNPIDTTNKYYYSVFVYYSNANNPSWLGIASIPPSSDMSWKKVGQVSSYVVYPDLDSNTGNPKTVDVVLSHIPNVYKLDSNGRLNTDLVKFVKLLSFHLDMYRSNIATVFDRYDLNQSDEILLKELLKEFGTNIPIINDLSLAKKILKYVVHYYRTDRGTSKGVQNSVELYGGMLSDVTSGRNLLPDYNTSSFLENTGSWYPDPAFEASYGGSGFATKPYSLNPDNGSNLALNSLSSSSFTFNTNNSILRKVAYSGSLGPATANTLATTYSTTLSKSYDSSGTFSTSVSLTATAAVPSSGTTTTLSVNSTNGIFVNALVSGGSVVSTSRVVSVGTGTVTIKPKTTSAIASGTSMTFTGDYAYPLYTDSVKLSAAVTSSTIINVTDTSSLVPGSRLDVISGNSTDILARPTFVTSILSSTSATVSYPVTLTATASMAVSRSLTSAGAAVKATTNNQSVSYYYSTLKYGIIDGADAYVKTNGYTAGINVMGPLNFKPGDYVLPAASGVQLDPSYTISKKDVKVVSVDKVKGTIVVNKDILSDILNIDAYVAKPVYVYFSKLPANEYSQYVDGVPVTGNTPYTFLTHFNAGGSTAKSTEVGVRWYDSKGSLISTSVATAAAPTSSAPYTNANFATTWYPTYVTSNSPSSAVFAVPYFTINNVSSTNSYYVDSAMLCKPLAIKSYSVSGTTVTVTTSEPHNFYPGNYVSVYESSNTTINTSGALITNVAQDPANKLYRFSYTVAGATSSAAVATGYVSSIPMMVTTSDGTNYRPLTVFEDSGQLDVDLKATRVNMCANPSFEKNINGWSATSGISLIKDDSNSYIGSNSLLVKFAANSSNSGKYVKYDWVASNSSVPSRLSVIPGKSYSASVYCWLSGLYNADDPISLKLSLSWYTSTDSYISITESPELTLFELEWTRLSLEGAIAPTNAAYAILKLYRSDTKTTHETWLSIDNVLVECLDVAGSYFDGSYDGFNFDPSRNSMWESGEHASPSHLYTDRVVNKNNIDSTLSEALYYG